MSWIGRGLLVSLVFAILGAAAPAAAHTELSEASPAPGAVLPAPPAEVVLVFTEAVTPAVDAVVVSGPDGARLDRGSPAVDPVNVLTTPLAAGGPGAVTVQYRVVAADGHVIVEGSYRFEVTGAPPTSGPAAAVAATIAAGPVAAPAVDPPSDDGNDTVGLVLLALAVLVGLVGGTAAWVVGRRGS